METKIRLKADIKPLHLLINIVNSALQFGKGSINFSDFPSKLARIEADNSPATTNELAVVFYPSDSFLRFASALCAGDFDFSVINNTFRSHNTPPNNKFTLQKQVRG